MTTQPQDIHQGILDTSTRHIEQQAQKRFKEREANRRETIEALETKAPTEVDDSERVRARLTSIPEGDGLALERIMFGNDLFPIAYFEKGLDVSRSVCRIELCDSIGRVFGHGTGFLISPSLLLTNNHVLQNKRWATYAQAEFNYQKDAARLPRQSRRFRATNKTAM
ncbi:MAG: hypothetical protein LDL30_13320 [Desulfovibrio sp.]|nr:hypothetical protein [Desulfovibrio sp.]